MPSWIQIIPRLPPLLDGVGDFGWQLASVLRQEHGISTQFIVCDSSWKGAGDQGGFPIRQLAEPTPKELQSALSSTLESAGDDAGVFLHYVGYGYASDGAPSWLLGGLEEFLKERPSIRLWTYFHEIWSGGPPWKKAFYWAFRQKAITRKLLQISTACWVNTGVAQREIQKHTGKDCPICPVPSTIPRHPGQETNEPRDSNGLDLVVFGQLHARVRGIQAHRGLLVGLNQQGHLGRLTLVGKDASRTSEDAQALKGFLPEEIWEVEGNAVPDRIAELLNHSDFMLSYYPAPHLTKSTAAMAALANGVPLILPSKRGLDSFFPKESVWDGSFWERQPSELWRLARSDGMRETRSTLSRWYQSKADWLPITRFLVDSAQ